MNKNIWLVLNQKNIFVNLHKKYLTIFNVQGRDAEAPSLTADSRRADYCSGWQNRGAESFFIPRWLGPTRLMC